MRERLQNERWVLGAAGEQTAVNSQYQTLSKDLTDLYTKDFIAAWRATLSRVKLKSLIADKPKYQVLGIASGSASPLKCLMESIKAETAVTRERPGFKPEGEAKKGGELVGDVADENTAAPGAEIEASFKPYFVMVDGDATKRPIDAIVSGLADINQSLISRPIRRRRPSPTPTCRCRWSRCAAWGSGCRRLSPPCCLPRRVILTAT